MRPFRLILAGFMTLGLAPGTLVRSPDLPDDYDRTPVAISALDTAEGRFGPFTLAGAWHLETSDRRFGGYSALITRGKGDLAAGSDTGRVLHIRIERGLPIVAQVGEPGRPSTRGAQGKVHRDIESLTFDPSSRKIWAGFEGSNAIHRFGADFSFERSVHPPAMSDWGSNSGPEAFTRLGDGRFLAIEERAREGDTYRALLFPGDPIDGDEPVAFLFKGMDGFRPVDAAARPDGKVYVLMRGLRFGLPPRFASAIMLLDPAMIAQNATAKGRVLAKFTEPFPPENYEGLALADGEDGRSYLWLISDDNLARYQRTLLVRLRVDAREKARE